MSVPSSTVYALLPGSDPTAILILNLCGTFVFGITGGLAGVRARLDPFGVLVLAAVVGLAGGITRDLLIGRPPSTFRDWRYLAVLGAAGVIAYLAAPALEVMTYGVRASVDGVTVSASWSSLLPIGLPGRTSTGKLAWIVLDVASCHAATAPPSVLVEGTWRWWRWPWLSVWRCRVMRARTGRIWRASCWRRSAVRCTGA